jgi:DnaJ domain
MAPDIDPYRTLGLERGAPLEEVKRAYRRLAKANHPDAAGESALPRFLAIQAAYDQIAGPDARTRRPGSRAMGGAGPRRPWDADPDRAGATHRAYGGRTRSRAGPRPRPAPPPPGPSARPGRSARPERPPNKATLGSTSYDGADAEPLDPDWGGASWYGTSSGTYWTLNPKEYADPRKHGPEYQARARRADQRQTAANPGQSETLAPDEDPADAEAAEAPTAPEAPTHTATSWWQSAPTERAGAAPTGAGAGGPAAEASVPPPWASQPRTSLSSMPGDLDQARDPLSTDALIGPVRAWLDDQRPGVGARIGRAVIGWAPIALGIGWFAGEISGCGRFSADCSPAVAPVSWGIQVAVLLVLILGTRLARVAARATVVTLAAVTPASVLLLATFDPEGMAAGRAVLGGLMLIAWIAGVGYGLTRELRRPAVDRPVS